MKIFFCSGFVKKRLDQLDLVWGLFLYSLVNGMGFDVSHSITNMGVSFYTKDKCFSAAKSLNFLSLKEKQIGLDGGVRLRYICLVIPQNGTTI